MKRAALLIAIVLVLPTIVTGGDRKVDQVPAIGTKVDRRWRKASIPNELCMTHSSQIDPCFERVINGIRYSIAYNSQSKRISYIFTDDENFRSSDGLKVGDEVPVSETTVLAWPGWQIYAPKTEDGWRPIIGNSTMEVTLTDGTNLNLWGKHDGSPSGNATVLGFAKGIWVPR